MSIVRRWMCIQRFPAGVRLSYFPVLHPVVGKRREWDAVMSMTTLAFLHKFSRFARPTHKN